MEVRINKEVRDYQESIFFGLSSRQFAFALLAVIAAVITYFAFKSTFGVSVVGWLCIVAAAPFEFPLQKQNGKFKPSPPGVDPDNIVDAKRQNKLFGR